MIADANRLTLTTPSDSRLADALQLLAGLLGAEPFEVVIRRPGQCLRLTVCDGPVDLQLEPRQAPPRADDERNCPADILAVLTEEGRRLTTSQILTELERRSWLWGEGTVKRHLAAMVADGTLDNDKDARPRGYTVASAPDAE